MEKVAALKHKIIELLLYVTVATWNLTKEISYPEMKELIFGKKLIVRQ
jgi:hypothetical protein